jgi:hypothetical protein
MTSAAIQWNCTYAAISRLRGLCRLSLLPVIKVTWDVAILGYVPQPFVAVLPAPCFSGTYSIDLSRLPRS